jgi:very-short-patch-repair endonuclease
MNEKRKILRNQSTEEERILWSVLKNKKFNNLKFRRQHSFHFYILDFYCPEKRLAIELDGS